MLDAKVLENWAVTNDDTILRRALKKTKKISQNPNDITILDYQRDQLFEALGFVTEFDVAIDAGANYGLMTYHLSHKFKEVHSFELFTPVRQCLEQNVRNFNLNNVKVYDCGLGEKEKFVDVELTTSFGNHVNPNNGTGEYLIKTIDSFNFRKVNFIKIDVEGYEPFLLKGAEKTIQKHKPVIIMERKGHTERWNLDKNTPVRMLESWGYIEKVSYSKDCIMIPRV